MLEKFLNRTNPFVATRMPDGAVEIFHRGLPHLPHRFPKGEEQAHKAVSREESSGRTLVRVLEEVSRATIVVTAGAAALGIMEGKPRRAFKIAAAGGLATAGIKVASEIVALKTDDASYKSDALIDLSSETPILAPAK